MLKFQDDIIIKFLIDYWCVKIKGNPTGSNWNGIQRLAGLTGNDSQWHDIKQRETRGTGLSDLAGGTVPSCQDRSVLLKFRATL